MSPTPAIGTTPQPSPYAPPIPNAVQDHPSQPYSPFRTPTAPVPDAAPPPKKSRKGLMIALGVLGLAAIGGIVAFALLRDDKPERSRDSVIRRTFAALAAGDDKTLYELSDPKHIYDRVARCEKQRKKADDDLLGGRLDDYRDPTKIEERWKKDTRQLLRRTKGVKIEIVDILTEVPPPIGTKPKKSSKRDDDDDDFRSERDRDRDRDRYREDDEDRPEHDKEFKTTTYKKGHELSKGCYAKVPFRTQSVKVVVDIKEGDREFTQRVRITLQEIDGQWYLSHPPNLNVGFDVVAADIQEWRDKTCKCADGPCVDDLDEEYGRLAYAHYELGRESDVPHDTMQKIEKLHQERKVCEGTARGGPELARYKELKEQVCACKDEECARKPELEMIELRRKVEANARSSRIPSYEVTRQVSDLALAAGECTRKLSQLRVRMYSAWPTSGETTGGTIVSIRGTNLMSTPRTAKVWFGTKEATVVRIASDYELIVEAPPQDIEGYVDVRVELNPGGSITVPYGFTYKAPPKKAKPKPKKPTTPTTPLLE